MVARHSTRNRRAGALALAACLLFGRRCRADAPTSLPVDPTIQQATQPATLPDITPPPPPPPMPPAAEPDEVTPSIGQQPVVAPTPPSIIQAPLPTEQPADQTPSQTNTNQFNQLFQFETTPDVCAAGEGYLSGQFSYFKFPGAVREYRYQIQGQYGLTDQVSVGAYIPVIHADFDGKHTGLGDIGIYGQYKFDQLINPEIVDVTVQADLILPTGKTNQLRDTGNFGVRPLALIYKDFGQQGPGTLGAYGLIGFTATKESDFRLGLAATYEIQRLAAVMEFFDTTGNRLGRPLVSITPGLVYRGLGPLELAAGVPLGVNNGSPHWGITFKLTYAFQN